MNRAERRRKQQHYEDTHRESFWEPIKKQFKKDVRFFILAIALIYIFYVQIGGIYARFGPKGEWRFMFANLGATKAEKMDKHHTGLGSFFEFFNEHTPEDAVVMYPPVTMDSSLGAGGLIKYFLVPRIMAKDNWRRLRTDDRITHTLLLLFQEFRPRQMRQSWPDFYVPIRNIYHFPKIKQALLKDFVIGSTEIKELKESDTKADRSQVKVGLHEGHIAAEAIYTHSTYDYYETDVNLPYSEGISMSASVKSNESLAFPLIARVQFKNGQTVIFSSAPNQFPQEEEVLEVDLSNQIEQYAQSQNISPSGAKIVSAGINLGYPVRLDLSGEKRVVPDPTKQSEKPKNDAAMRAGTLEIEHGQTPLEDFADAEILNADHYFKMGHSYQKRKQFDKAIKAFQTALVLEDKNPWYAVSIGDVYFFHLEDYENAQKYYQLAVNYGNTIPWTHYMLGETYRMLGDTNNAFKQYDFCAALSISSAWCLTEMGKIAEAQGETDKALNLYKFSAFHYPLRYDSVDAWNAIRIIDKSFLRKVKNLD